jgi:putative heme-binding domain-containing protein
MPGDRRKRVELDAERQLLADITLGSDPPDVRRAAVQLLEALGPPASATNGPVFQRAEQLVADPHADAELRAAAVRVLSLQGADRYKSLLTDVLSRAEPASVQVAAVRALASVAGDDVAPTLLQLWDRWPPAVRDEAVSALARDPGRVRALLDAVATGKVRITEVDRALRIRLMMLEDDALRARARSLFAEPAAARTEAVNRYGAAASLTGDPERGRQVFTRACSSCHQYRGSGGVAFGPDLGEVRNRLPPALVIDILQPNHSIADGYELWIAELTGGTRVTGVIGAETPTSVTFRRAGGGETTVAREQIESMRISELSAMPDGLEAQIDLQQMADLIAFIKGAPGADLKRP